MNNMNNGFPPRSQQMHLERNVLEKHVESQKPGASVIYVYIYIYVFFQYPCDIHVCFYSLPPPAGAVGVIVDHRPELSSMLRRLVVGVCIYHKVQQSRVGPSRDER